MLEEFREAVIFFSLTGRGITLEGLGTFLPFIKQDGRISLSHRLDRSIWAAINAEGEFTGQIINRENIGKATWELNALWNANHPEDFVPTG